MAITVVTDLRNVANASALSWTTPALAIGDIVIVTMYSEDSINAPMAAPTATGITFIQQVRDVTASHCFVAIYSGVATATGVTTITSANNGGFSNVHSGCAYIFPLADGYSLSVTPNTVDTRGTDQPAGTQAGVSGSICVGVNGDWAAVNPSTRAYRGTVTQDGTSFLSGAATGYFWHQTLATTSTTIGLTAPTGQTYTIAGIEVLAPGGAFTGSATTTATLTGAAAGNVDHSTGATATVTLAGVAAGVVGKSSGATATLGLAGVAAGGTGGGATTGVALAGAAAGVVGTSSGATATLSLTGVAAGQGSQPSSGATSTLSLAATAAGVVGTSTGATATLALAGVAAGVASAPGGNATATLNLTGVTAGQVGTASGATSGVALAGVAAGTVGTSSGATLTLTLTGLATGANTRTGTADTTLTLTGAADGVVRGGGGDAAIVLELIAEASGTVTGLGARTFTPDLPDWTRENTAAIVYSETKTIGPFEQVIFGLIGVGSYTINTHTDTINQGIRLLLSYQATLDPNSGIAVAVLSVDESPISAQYVGYESPSYGGQLSIYNQDPAQSYEVTVWSSNRVVTTPRYLGDLLPSRLFGSPVGLTSGVDVFVQPGDYVTFGYCANVLTGLYIDSPINGTLWFQYLAATGPPFRVAVATVVGGTPQLITVPLPFAQGNFYFTPSTTDPAGRIIIQAFPARNG